MFFFFLCVIVALLRWPRCDAGAGGLRHRGLVHRAGERHRSAGAAAPHPVLHQEEQRGEVLRLAPHTLLPYCPGVNMHPQY